MLAPPQRVVVCNRPRSIYQYSNMTPRLSGQTSIFGVVFFVSKSLLGIEGQRKLEKFAIWPESLGAMLEYWYIERGLFISRMWWSTSEPALLRPNSFGLSSGNRISYSGNEGKLSKQEPRPSIYALIRTLDCRLSFIFLPRTLISI